MLGSRIRFAVLLISALLVVAAPAAGEPYQAIPGGGAGPARYDRVFVETFGSPRARTVVVLVPGFIRGAGSLRLVAREIARRAGVQVWALDRRANALEDHSILDLGEPYKSFDYYLRFAEVDGRRHVAADARTAPFARGWGLRVSLDDLRQVVRRARAGRRRVILGGHSFGATTALSYAVWDFAGRAGYRDLDGLIAIDGGGQRSRLGAARARRRLAAIRTGDPFVGLLKRLPPWSAQLFETVGTQLARAVPEGLSPAQSYPLLPAYLRPDFPVTNLAELGYARDVDTAPPELEIFHLHSGELARSGDPRGWVDGGITPISRVAEADGTSRPTDATEWYYPARLRLDSSAVGGYRPSPASRALGLRLEHLAGVDVPLYAFQTGFTDGRVLRGARAFAGASRVPRTTMVDRSRTTTHEDPIYARPRDNAFLQTVVPFIRSIDR